jgi:4-amino-4-deoxy-L-arabinose transferase-like glycosyltransferase
MLAVIVVAGLVARVVYIIIARDQSLWSDSLGYHYRAHLLADGDGFVLPALQVLGFGDNPPDASVPPAWTTFLALAAKLGIRSVLSQQFVACGVGAATIAMTGLAGRAAFGRRTGLISAAIVAVYPNVWIYERELLSEPLAMCGVATCIWLAYSFIKRPGLPCAVALGAVTGLLALTRSEQIAIALLVVVPVILSAHGVTWQRRFTWLALAGASCVLVLSPWVVYNATRFDEPVLLSTGLGGTMRAGNCTPTYSGPLLGSFQTTYTVGDRDECSILDEEFADDPTVAEGQLRRAAIQFMNENRTRVPVVVAARIGRTFNIFRPFQQVHFEAERASSVWVIRLGLFTYWILAPLAVLGAVITRRRRIPLYPLLAFPIVTVLAVALTIGAVRYRAPAEIPLALLAAVAIDALVGRWTRRSGQTASGTALPGPQESSVLVDR